MVYLYIGILIVAISFFLLTIYLAKVLSSVATSLTSLGQTLSDVEKQLEGITEETEGMVQETHHIADDVKEKTDALDPLFHSLHGLGTNLVKLNHSLEQVPASMSSYSKQHGTNLSKAFLWGDTAWTLYQKWNMTKHEHPNYAKEGGKR